jgi:shikimate kinase
MKNIYLIGMMGSGKTSTARELARRLGMNVVDLDEWIEDRAHKSVNDIFAQDGEGAFRSLESEALAEISQGEGHVVATGGGVVLSQINVKRMQETGLVIYLKTGLDVLWDRVKDKKDRPLLKATWPREKLRELAEARTKLYERAARLAVTTDRKTPAQVAKEIEMACRS